MAEALREPEECTRLYALAIIHDAAGRRAESDAALQELIAKYQAEWTFQIASVYATRGEADRAFEWIERAYAQRDSGLCELKVERTVRSLYRDPRWNAFLCKMGLAD